MQKKATLRYCPNCSMSLGNKSPEECVNCFVDLKLAENLKNSEALPIAYQMRRFLGYLVDVLAVMGLGVVLGICGALFGFSQALEDDALLNAISLLLALSYYIVTETVWQRTLGKLVTGTKVVDVSGNKPTLSQVLVRTIVRFVPFEVFSMGGFHPVAWHDKWAKTRVVRSS